LGRSLAHSIAFAPRTHFVLLEIEETQITMKATGVDGEVFDEATIPLTE
jgi:hypothetical protein